MLSYPPRRRPRGPLPGRGGTVSSLLEELDLLPGRVPTLERQLGFGDLGAGDEGVGGAAPIAVVVALVVVVAVVEATAAVLALGVVIAVVAVARRGGGGRRGRLALEDGPIGDRGRERLAGGRRDRELAVGERRDRGGRGAGDLARVGLLDVVLGVMAAVVMTAAVGGGDGGRDEQAQRGQRADDLGSEHVSLRESCSGYGGADTDRSRRSHRMSGHFGPFPPGRRVRWGLQWLWNRPSSPSPVPIAPPC